ncbi:MAG: CBS domain-containing protein [Candidatus Gracilibacteria bacterium]|nr:CBS domain-containing protein [Candidatus Gracilibacteria bacterium]
MADNFDPIAKAENSSLSSKDIEKIYYNDKNEFVKALKEKVDRLTIGLDTKTKINDLLISIERNRSKNNKDGNIVWTYLEQEKFEEKVIGVDKNHNDNQLTEIISSELDREDIEAYLRGIRNFKREEISNKDEIYSPERELGIVVRKDNTVLESLKKMKDNKYNCVVLLDDENRFLGIFTKHQLAEFDENLKLESIMDQKIDISGNQKISNEKAGEIMQGLGINALPILNDDRTLYGVLSIKSLELNNIENTCMLSLTKLNLNYLMK